MTNFDNSGAPCMNCGRPAAEHVQWPQCPDGAGWRVRMAQNPYMADRAGVLRDIGRLPQKHHSPAWWVVAALAALVVLLAGISFVNPNVNVPLISPVVCSLKGDTWYGGGILGAPGCYRPANGG